MQSGAAKPIPDERLEQFPTAERTVEEDERYRRSQGAATVSSTSFGTSRGWDHALGRFGRNVWRLGAQGEID